MSNKATKFFAAMKKSLINNLTDYISIIPNINEKDKSSQSK